MTDEKDPPQEDGPVQRYRFRVRTADGRELISHVASVRLPPAPAPAPAPVKAVTDAPVLPEQAVPAALAPGKSYALTGILASAQGAKQGAFKQDKGMKHGHQFAAAGLDFALSVPRDPSSGQATGKRLHGPVVLIKALGPSSPQFRSALAANETLTSLEFSCLGVEQHGPGADVEFFTMKLTNASVSAVELVMPDTRHADLKKVPEHERISFTYQTIEWTWKDGGISAQDTWA